MTDQRSVRVYSGIEPLSRGNDRSSVAQAAAEAAMLDNTLIGYHSFAPDGWILAANLLALNSSFRALIAHRPGVVHPVATARMAATLSAVSGGRVALNVVTGGAPGDQFREGDYVAHDDRYRRSVEYVEVLRKIWSATEPFSHEGEFYKIEGTRPGINPGHPIEIHVSGSSGPGVDFAARCADTYMFWAEPLKDVEARIVELREVCARYDRPLPRLSMNIRLFLARTDDEAWALARSNPDYVKFKTAGGQVSTRKHSEDAGRNRLLQLARESEVHDDCLWTGVTAALGGLGSTTGLVGTPERVLQALQKYVDIGVDTFLVTPGSGFNWDSSLIPFVKKIRSQIKIAPALSASVC